MTEHIRCELGKMGGWNVIAVVRGPDWAIETTLALDVTVERAAEIVTNPPPAWPGSTMKEIRVEKYPRPEAVLF